MTLRPSFADSGMAQAEHCIRASRAWLGVLLLAYACADCKAPERYSTRGLVQARVGSGEAQQLAIHHEALPAFKDREGQVAPMSSMTMLFGLAPQLRLPNPGAMVAFEFEVRWDERPSLLITRLQQLPDSTQLELTSDHH